MSVTLVGLTFALAAATLSRQSPPAPAEGSSDYVRFDLVQYLDRVEANGLSTRTIEAKILLRTATAVAQFGQIGWPYVDGYGEVQFDEVTIEKPDGRTVDGRNGLVEDLNPFGVTGSSVAADVRVKKLTIRGIEPGDRLRYRIVLRQKPLTPGRVFGEMKLPPLLGDPLQTYVLDLPRDAGIRVRLRDGLGATWEDVSAPADRLVRKLTFKVDRPDPADEGPSKARVQAWAEPDVTFTSFRSWPEIAQWWSALARGRLDPDAAVGTEAAALVASKATTREKIEALHRFLAVGIRYVNVSFGIGRMQPRPAPDVLANRYGDCKDKHALLAAMSSAVGIDVRPVLIHSLRSDLRDDVPSPQQFDHMISVIRLGPEPGDWLWLDATNPLGVPGYLLPNLRDKRALLVESGGEGRIVRTPAEPPFTPRTEVEVKGTLDPDRALRGHAVWHLRSDDEVALRAVFAALPEDRRAEAVRTSLARDWKGGKVTNVVVSDPLDVAAPFRVEFDVERPAPSTPPREEWGLWIPLPDPDLPKPEKATASTDGTVEFALREVTGRAEIETPEGLNVRAPLSVSLDRPFGKFESAYSVEGRRLTVVRTLRFSRRTLADGELASYEAFRKAVDTDRDQEFSVVGTAVLGRDASAKALRGEGLAAFDRKEYAKAVELLRKATEADPKVEDGFEDLGRALREAGEDEEALRAFSRQIEIDPFHEVAYAERAHTLIRRNRWEEAEKDLLKQIEVAPFKPWSYERLGRRRMVQERFREAAEYYSRAAALEPRKAERWADLAEAHQKDGRSDEVRADLDRIRGLDPPDWLKIRAGVLYHALGDTAAAADLAVAALPSVAQRLASLSADSFGEDDLYWVERLAEGWYLVGTAALAAGDATKAERFLDGAWKLAFLPEAAWALGNLREKQGEQREAVGLWSMASSVPTAASKLPADRQNRIEAARRGLLESRGLPDGLMNLRMVRFGPAVADLSEEVLVLAGPDGRVERIRGVSPKNPAALDLQLLKATSLRLALSAPEERPFKAVRRGLLACAPSTGCALMLSLPGQAHVAEKLGSIQIERLDPPEGSTFRRGQRAKVVVVVRYDLQARENGTVALVVQDQGGKPLVVPQPVAAVKRGSGEIELTGTFVVPRDATRVDVFLPLNTGSQGITSTVAKASYAVE